MDRRCSLIDQLTCAQVYRHHALSRPEVTRRVTGGAPRRVGGVCFAAAVKSHRVVGVGSPP